MKKSFVLPATDNRQVVIDRVFRFVSMLDATVPWSITVERFKRTRSTQQNAYLWGVVYPTILREGGLGGWTAADLHEFFLGEHFGWQELEGLGRKKVKPLKRSSKLSTLEFNDFVAFIQRHCAGLGLYVPDPNEGESPW